MINYENKYLKYKKKYLDLYNQIGGNLKNLENKLYESPNFKVEFTTASGSDIKSKIYVTVHDFNFKGMWKGNAVYEYDSGKPVSYPRIKLYDTKTRQPKFEFSVDLKFNPPNKIYLIKYDNHVNVIARDIIPLVSGGGGAAAGAGAGAGAGGHGRSHGRGRGRGHSHGSSPSSRPKPMSRKPFEIIQSKIHSNLFQINGRTSQEIALHRSTGDGVGVLIAGNAGRPAGGVGKVDGTGLEDGGKYLFSSKNSTQEEDIVQSWLWTEHFINGNDINDVFRKQLGDLVPGGRPYGMVTPGSRSPATIQGHDYTVPFTKGPSSDHTRKYDFAHVVEDVDIAELQHTFLRKDKSGKHNEYIIKNKNLGKVKTVDLVFVFGPNIAYNSKSGPTGTATRTKVKSYDDSQYLIFRDCVKTTLRSGLLAMIKRDKTTAILASISGGIYSEGATKKFINQDLFTIMEEILSENHPDSPPGSSVIIGSYFTKIIYPSL